MVNVAILGYGTVGSGVAEVISHNNELIRKRIGDELQVKYILDLRDFPGDPNEHKVVHDVDIILNDPEISIVCEVMGGNEPAFSFSRRALQAGKSVCTSNKELVANHGAELIALARENHCNYLFEASVGGGIPIIRPLSRALTAEQITEITGILNGTTNYILTKMEKEGAEFEDALKEAQEKGYAERNPEADVEGYDACRKIAILCSLMTGQTVDFQDIYTEGITKITSADFDYAKAMDMTVKLLATAQDHGEGKYMAAVAPCLLDKDNPLFGISDVFNAIIVEGNMLGETMYYGRGAGKLPTASAVVGDVIDCAKHPDKHIPCIWEEKKVTLQEYDSAVSRFFVRTLAEDAGRVKELFGHVMEINLEQYPEEFGFVTDPLSERDFAERIKQLPGFITRIRIKD